MCLSMRCVHLEITHPPDRVTMNMERLETPQSSDATLLRTLNGNTPPACTIHSSPLSPATPASVAGALSGWMSPDGVPLPSTEAEVGVRRGGTFQYRPSYVPHMLYVLFIRCEICNESNSKERILTTPSPMSNL